jgi:glycosyltransferase involved in cell wall biosynthesis
MHSRHGSTDIAGRGSGMRILHLGNLCNNSYKLAKFQRALGHDARLELTADQIGTGDDPAWEDPELADAYPDWIDIREISRTHGLSWFAGGVRRIVGARRRARRDFDVVHAQCTAPIMAQFIAPDRLVSHCLGSDLRELAQGNSLNGYLLRRAYRKSRVVFFNNVDHVAYLKALGIEGVFLPNPLDLDRFRPGTPSRRPDGFDFVVFHPSRLDWVGGDGERSSTKGNDRLIRAFARFLEERPRALLLLLNSGTDVAATKELVRELGIGGNVRFLERMRKDELVETIRSADVVADQFDVGAFGGTALEVLACGRPLLTYLKEDCARTCYGELPPILNGRDEEGILAQLRLAADSDLEDLGARARAWVERHHDWRKVAGAVVDRYSAAIA